MKTLFLGTAAVLAGMMPSPCLAAPASFPIELSQKKVSFAVLGDTPYGADQVVDLPNLISAINADSDVSTVVHLGDIKTGSSRCDTSYFEQVRDQFDTLADPFIFTPGDNEWTDCHRKGAGKFDPLERLDVLREVFYPVPGQSLGERKRWVFSQAYVPGLESFPENQLWLQSSVVFSVLHVVGSNNGLAPWFTDDATDALMDDPERREAEVEARTDATLDWLDRTFFLASLSHAKGVALFMQADMWDAFSVTNNLPLDGFDVIVQRIADLSAAYKKPVLILQGDSHSYLVDQPLAQPDVVHNVSVVAPNVTRIVVQGSTTREWLKLSVDPRSRSVFSWQRMQR